METFFILMIVVFLPFGWFILRMLRYTGETVGENSPLHIERTYHFSASHYFGDFLRIANPILVVMMLGLAFITSKEAMKQQEPLLFLFSVFFLGFAGLFCFVICFDWQYWLITRNVLVTFNPLKKSITVDGPSQYSVLRADTVIRIEQHIKKTSNAKDVLGGYGYYLFYTADNQITQINNIFFGHVGHFEFLERFFPNIPKTIIEHRLPWITDISHTENPESPNFAA